MNQTAQIGDEVEAQESGYAAYAERKKFANMQALRDAFAAWQRQEHRSEWNLYKVTGNFVRGKLHYLESMDGSGFEGHGMTDDFVQDVLMDVFPIVERGEVRNYAALVNRITFTKRKDSIRELMERNELAAPKQPDGDNKPDDYEVVNEYFKDGDGFTDDEGNPTTDDPHPLDRSDKGLPIDRGVVKRIIEALDPFTYFMPWEYRQVCEVAMDSEGIDGEGRGISRDELKRLYASDELGGQSPDWVDKKVTQVYAWIDHVWDITQHRDEARWQLLSEAYRRQTLAHITRRPASESSTVKGWQQPSRRALAYAIAAETIAGLLNGLDINSVDLDGATWKRSPVAVDDVDTLVLCELSALKAAQRIQPNVDPSLPLSWVHQHYWDAYSDVLDRLQEARELQRGGPVTRRVSRTLVDERTVTLRLMQRAKVRQWAKDAGARDEDATMTDWASADGFTNRNWAGIRLVALALLDKGSLTSKQVEAAMNSTSNPTVESAQEETAA
jgi:hypothetical protein